MKPRVETLCLSIKTMDHNVGETVATRRIKIDALLPQYFFCGGCESTDQPSIWSLFKTHESSEHGV